MSACTQCCAGKCAIAFHATCSVLAGGPLVPSDWPQPVEAYCDRHRRDKFKVGDTTIKGDLGGDGGGVVVLARESPLKSV